MFGDRDPCHYLKPLASTNVPKRLLWLDVTPLSMREQGAWVERWASGIIGTTHFTSRAKERRDCMYVHTEPNELWERVDAFCMSGKRQVLWADDLALQMRLSQALVHLPANGWQLRKIVLERTASWALFTEGKRSLMLCDIRSWIVGGLSRKQRSQERVEALREAVMDILAWIEAEDLGPFRPTGSGQSYSAFRKRFLTHRVLVHDDMQRLDVERKAMWTGRCEAWEHGKLDNGPFYEYDLHAAYATIAATCHVPSMAVGQMHKPTIANVMDRMQTHAVLADITVSTHSPCVPTGENGRTLWPTGTFRTCVWDPELTLAINHAYRVIIHKAYLYRRAPILQDFAQWVLNGMDNPDVDISPIVRQVLKHWSRALVGRLGLRYRSWIPFGTSSEPDLRLVTYIDTDEGTSTDMLCAGYNRMILAGMAEASESLPQIPSWVMSECRRRLWDSIHAIGSTNVVYMDTDSMILRSFGPDMPEVLHLESSQAEWRLKGKYTSLNIRGPRNLDIQLSRRVSGLPKTARQTAPLEFTGHVMRSIKESMRTGELDCVASIPRNFTLKSIDTRRKHLSNGRTEPFRLDKLNV